MIRITLTNHYRWSLQINMLFKSDIFILTMPNIVYITHDEGTTSHYSDVIMSTVASQITGASVVCSTACSSAHQTKHICVTGLCEGYLPVTGGFPSQRASDALKGFHLMTSSWVFIVRHAGLIWSQQDFEWWWSVPLSSASVLEFSFILFDLCLFVTIFNFILNYVPIVTFWILTYHKIWILLIIFCFIWNYWIIDFFPCLEMFWSVVN